MMKVTRKNVRNEVLAIANDTDGFVDWEKAKSDIPGLSQVLREFVESSTAKISMSRIIDLTYLKLKKVK